MSKYRCFQTVVVDDCFKGTKEEVKFVEGRDYALSDESYARWERRGVFGPIPEKRGRGRKKAANAAPAGDDTQAGEAGPPAAMSAAGGA